MATPRAELVNLDVTPYYHCVARCVRRAFLCGDDAYSGRNFDHRKRWVVERIKLLADVFAIDVCAYAVMSNHLHIVLRVDPGRVVTWTDAQVARRVRRIFPATAGALGDLPARAQREWLAKWRARLTSISWLMRCLNEWVARRANQEDDCTGRFWEGRFRSQALLDAGAVLACMSYVDLNPVRAKMAKSLSGSRFTSIRERLRAASVASGEGRPQPTTPSGLAPMAGERKRDAAQERLPISLVEYVELLEWTGRALRDDKRGAISGPPSKLLAAADLNAGQWLESVRDLGRCSWDAVGGQSRLAEAAAARGRRWCRGHRWVRKMYRVA